VWNKPLSHLTFGDKFEIWKSPQDVPCANENIHMYIFGKIFASYQSQFKTVEEPYDQICCGLWILLDLFGGRYPQFPKFLRHM
jgi:hypothetical protein